MHEIQRILQAVHNRPSGISYARASKKANARMVTLRANRKIKCLTEKEKSELDFYESLNEKYLNNYFYYNDDGELEYLIEHPILFEKYKGIGQVKVLFFNGEENKGEVEIPKTLNIINNLYKCVIKITLNFRYYAEHYKEFKTIDSNEPDLARESILLHELQRILQAVHNRPAGISYAGASKKVNARINTLRANKVAKRITKEEESQLDFYESLSDSSKISYFYYIDKVEVQAR